MSDFPAMSDASRLERPAPKSGVLPMVPDTDTYNEVDDQFALAHAVLSPERLNVEAVYAAPFQNPRASSPAEGMELSYEEILRLLGMLDRSPDGWAFKGSTRYLDAAQPEPSDAVRDLIGRAMQSPHEDPLYVVAIGAVTNVANAILIEPRIIERIVVVWLGGHALHWPHTREFNLCQDLAAARLILDCGVPVVLIPCQGVTTHLHTTVAELERYVYGKSRLGDYLVDIVREYQGNPYAWSKIIWDVATIAYLLDDGWVPTHVVHSPVLTDQVTWSVDQMRHLIKCAHFVHRDPIFRDLFAKLAAFGDNMPQVQRGEG